jgi:hypothetical protein
MPCGFVPTGIAVPALPVTRSTGVTEFESAFVT